MNIEGSVIHLLLILTSDIETLFFLITCPVGELHRVAPHEAAELEVRTLSVKRHKNLGAFKLQQEHGFE